MKKRSTHPNARDKLKHLEITERFGVFEFATEKQLVMIRTVLELMPKSLRAKHAENFFAECAEAGAWMMLTGAYCVAGKQRVAAATARARKSIEQEYKPSRKPKRKQK